MNEAILSWTGAIASFIGTGVTIFQSIKVRKDKKAVEKYAFQVQTNLQMTEISTLIEKGNKAKTTVQKYSSKTKTSVGLNEAKDKTLVLDFITAVNEKKHLIKEAKIDDLLDTGKKLLNINDYDNLVYNISNILSILEKNKDRAFLYDGENIQSQRLLESKIIGENTN